jgi:hypothetical protein
MIAAFISVIVVLVLIVVWLTQKCVDQQGWIEKREIYVSELEWMLEHKLGPLALVDVKAKSRKGGAK